MTLVRLHRPLPVERIFFPTRGPCSKTRILCWGDNNRDAVAAAIIPAAPPPMTTRSAEIGAVSYTHLDVYKRQTLDHIRTRFDRESGVDFMERFTRLQDKAIQLQKDGVPPESEQGQEFAEKFWKMVLEFTDGDMAMLPKLCLLYTSIRYF